MSKKSKRPTPLIRRWVISSLAGGDKKVQEIINNHKHKYEKTHKEFTALQYNSIYTALKTLLTWGVVELIEKHPRKYTLKEGCFNGVLVFKLKVKDISKEGKVFHFLCENPTECICPEIEERINIRKVSKECLYWNLLRTLREKDKILLKAD